MDYVATVKIAGANPKSDLQLETLIEAVLGQAVKADKVTVSIRKAPKRGERPQGARR